MNRRIFADHVRRGRYGYFLLFCTAALPWIAAADNAMDIHMALAFTLAIAGMGAPAAWQALTIREIRVLPVSRRDLWRTAWWLGVVRIVGFVTLGQLVGLTIGTLLDWPNPLRLQTTGVTAVLSFAVAGINASLIPLINWSASERGKRSTFGRTWRAMLLVAGMIGTLAWPFVIRRTLPLTWLEFNPAWFTVTVVGVALAARSYFQHPAPPPLARTQAAGARRIPRSFSTISRIGGVGRMVLQTWKTATLVQVTIPAMVVVTFTLVSRLMFHDSGDGMRTNLRDFGFLPFEAATYVGLRPPNFVSLVYLLGASVFWWNLLAPGDSLLSMVRHLRTLPMSVARLNSVLLALPILAWINFWFLLFVLHFAVSDKPIGTLAIPQWMAFIGVDALTRAFKLRTGEVNNGKLWFGTALVVSMTVSSLPGLLVFGAGAIAFVSGAVLNLHTLRTSSKAYHPARAQVAGNLMAGS